MGSLYLKLRQWGIQMGEAERRLPNPENPHSHPPFRLPSARTQGTTGPPCDSREKDEAHQEESPFDPLQEGKHSDSSRTPLAEPASKHLPLVPPREPVSLTSGSSSLGSVPRSGFLPPVPVTGPMSLVLCLAFLQLLSEERRRRRQAEAAALEAEGRVLSAQERAHRLAEFLQCIQPESDPPGLNGPDRPPAPQVLHPFPHGQKEILEWTQGEDSPLGWEGLPALVAEVAQGNGEGGWEGEGEQKREKEGVGGRETESEGVGGSRGGHLGEGEKAVEMEERRLGKRSGGEACNEECESGCILHPQPSDGSQSKILSIGSPRSPRSILQIGPPHSPVTDSPAPQPRAPQTPSQEVKVSPPAPQTPSQELKIRPQAPVAAPQEMIKVNPPGPQDASQESRISAPAPQAASEELGASPRHPRPDTTAQRPAREQQQGDRLEGEQEEQAQGARTTCDVPNSSVPNSSASSSAVPNSTVSSSAVPNSTVSSSAVPKSTVSSSAVPNSAVSGSTVRDQRSESWKEFLEGVGPEICGRGEGHEGLGNSKEVIQAPPGMVQRGQGPWGPGTDVLRFGGDGEGEQVRVAVLETQMEEAQEWLLRLRQALEVLLGERREMARQLAAGAYREEVMECALEAAEEKIERLKVEVQGLVEVVECQKKVMACESTRAEEAATEAQGLQRALQDAVAGAHALQGAVKEARILQEALQRALQEKALEADALQGALQEKVEEAQALQEAVKASRIELNDVNERAYWLRRDMDKLKRSMAKDTAAC